VKILFVHPHGSNWMGAMRDITAIFNLMPPLGLMSIASYLESKGETIDIIDCYGTPAGTGELAAEIVARAPDVAAFSCTTSSFLEGYAIAERVKENAPDIRIVFGGAHACSVGAALLDSFPAIDYLVIGEGEVSLYELVRANFRDVTSVPGIGYRLNGVGTLSSVRENIADLDTLPFPAYHLLPGFPKRYNLPLFSYPKAPNTSIISSRGCPYQCSYCDRSVFRRTFRYNSADYLYRHLHVLRTQFGIRHINFYDDHFTFHRERIVAFCRRMIEEPLGMTFNCAVRAEHVDPELLGLMKRAGCWMISLGIETGDPDLLAQHRQNADLELMSRTIRAVHKAGIRVKGLFMIGLPGETEQSFRRTMDYVFSLPIDDLNVARFTPFPGSPLYENIHALGRFDENWEKMDCMNTVFVPHGMTAERLESLFLEFYKRYYTRPKTLWNFVSMIWKSPDSWRRFLANAGSFLTFARANRRIVERS
jgi:anaerobic magnesium-protoporphyrin IX monomethyl ester cyclase